MEYTIDEVREAAETNEHPIPLKVRAMLRNYASLTKAMEKMAPVAWWYPVGVAGAAVTTDATLVEHETNAPWRPLYEFPPNNQGNRSEPEG